MSDNNRLVSPLQKGMVIDHITPGLGIKLFNRLGLENCTAVLLTNCKGDNPESVKKDMIKIEDRVDLDYHIIGLLDPNATVTIIEDGKVKPGSKRKASLPETVEDVIICKNPRCVAALEPVKKIFRLRDREKRIYRCAYCEEEVNALEL